MSGKVFSVYICMSPTAESSKDDWKSRSFEGDDLQDLLAEVVVAAFGFVKEYPVAAIRLLKIGFRCSDTCDEVHDLESFVKASREASAIVNGMLAGAISMPPPGGLN